MKAWINDHEVRRHVPRGYELPPRFDDFVRAEPPYRVEWNDLDSYSLKPTATKEAVPFLRLPDGGLVALWYCDPSPAVVHIGAHGELQVLARDFDDFLRALAVKRSGLPDFDEANEPFRAPGVSGRPNTKELPVLQARFQDWFKRHTSLREPLTSPEAEALRQRVFQVAERMVHDGLSKVYTAASPWWSINFRVERGRKEVSVTYLDFGKWYPVPKKYRLRDEVPALLGLVLHKARSQYDLTVCSPGIVSIDRDRELLLVPPGYKPG